MVHYHCLGNSFNFHTDKDINLKNKTSFYLKQLKICVVITVD